MTRYLIEFETMAIEGRDAEFNTWYDTVHVQDILRIDGFRSCRRFRIDKAGARALYVASYEVEVEDPAQALDDLFSRAASMVISPALDRSFSSVRVMTPLSSFPGEPPLPDPGLPNDLVDGSSRQPAI